MYIIYAVQHVCASPNLTADLHVAIAHSSKGLPTRDIFYLSKNRIEKYSLIGIFFVRLSIGVEFF